MTAQRSPVGGDRARASVLDREQLRRRYLAERDERLVQGMRDRLEALTAIGDSESSDPSVNRSVGRSPRRGGCPRCGATRWLTELMGARAQLPCIQWPG
jgi:hypothetical protein